MFQEFFNNFNFFLNFKLISVEEIIIIFMFYNFIKIIIFGSIFELIWPTQFFNKRHNLNKIKYRDFIETILKLKINNNVNNVYNLYLLDYFFLKK